MQRRSSFIRASASLIIWGAVVCAANACKAPDDPAPPTNTTNNSNNSGGSGNNGSPGTPNNSAGFSVILTGSNATKFAIHDTSDTTTWTTPCKIEATATGNATNIFCTVEAPEADLFYQGLHLNYNVPTTMCTYLWVAPYGFFNQQVADGPAQITYWVDATGNYGIDTNNDGAIDGAPNRVYGPGAVVSTIASIANGKLTCLYDKTAAKALNCCTGTYALTVLLWDPAANGGAGAYKSTTTPNQDWGGSTTRCYSGPFKDLSTRQTEAGLPDSTVYFTDGVGFNKNMDLAAPDAKGYASNVYIANFVNPADHGVPTRPAALIQPASSDPAPPVNPYYDFGCMDQAFEYKARIRIDVREYNTYTEWSKKGSGNPDVVGAESPPYAGSGNNDIADWRDFELFTPGAAWPMDFL